MGQPFAKIYRVWPRFPVHNMGGLDGNLKAHIKVSVRPPYASAILILVKSFCGSGFQAAKRRGKMPLSQNMNTRSASS